MQTFFRPLLFALVALGLTSRVSAAVETYVIDPVHSSVGFSIRHFVGKVSGRFTRFEGTIKVDRDDPSRSVVTAAVQVASIDTNSQKRDHHLRSADFLDATRFPEMTFKSKGWRKTGENGFDVTGDLTIKDVTKEIVLKVSLLGFVSGDNGAQLAGWEATTKIDKMEFNVKDPPMLDAAIGDDVTITINVEAKKT